MQSARFHPEPDDALLIVDVQNDFLPGGTLPVPAGDRVVDPLNRYVESFVRAARPVFASRDWHPANHCSFRDQGGPWPAHCLAGSPGAEIATDLRLPERVLLIDKGTAVDRDAYSAFSDTTLDALLRGAGIRRLCIGGLATDYCVLETVRSACNRGYPVLLLTDAIQAVEASPGDGERALREMLSLGAVCVDESDCPC